MSKNNKKETTVLEFIKYLQTLPEDACVRVVFTDTYGYEIFEEISSKFVNLDIEDNTFLWENKDGFVLDIGEI